jgi:hypothetical protein
MKRSVLCIILMNFVGMGAWASGLSSPEEPAMNAIRPDAIRAHMRFLSDSLLQGRGLGTPGYQVAAHYVAAQLETAGLHPAGAGGTWYQNVPLRKSVTVDSESSLSLITGSGEQVLTPLKDYVHWGDLNKAENSVQAALVFVGFGVSAPERGYDDYAGADVRHKIVVLLLGAPAKFPSTVRAYYSDYIVKQRTAVAHGAVGYIELMMPEDVKRLPWEWFCRRSKWEIRHGWIRMAIRITHSPSLASSPR